MKNTPHRHTASTMRATILLSARLNGCDCNPEFDVPTRRERRAGVMNVTLHHDDHCTLWTAIREREAQP